MGVHWGHLSEVASRSRLCFALVDEQIHVLIALFIRLLKLVVKKLRMINAEAPVLAAHAYNLVNHVVSVLGDLRPCVLLADHFTDLLVLSLFDIKEGLGGCSTRLFGFLLVDVLSDDFVCFHVAVEVFLYDVMALGVSGALCALGTL